MKGSGLDLILTIFNDVWVIKDFHEQVIKIVDLIIEIVKYTDNVVWRCEGQVIEKVVSFFNFFSYW